MPMQKYMFDATTNINTLHIENYMGDSMSFIPKGVYKYSLHNPNARATPNYSILEDFPQTLCDFGLRGAPEFPFTIKCIFVCYWGYGLF
jgi:hypothetical protein